MRFTFAVAFFIAIPLQLTAANTTQITILQTTDLHDHANGADHVGLDVNPQSGTGSVGSYARIAAYINSVRRTAGHPVLLVDSGDWTMGTLYDLTLGDTPLALLFMDFMHYDVVTLGNHEFDYGPAGLARILKAARSVFGFHTPIVASNMTLGGNTDLANLTETSRIVKVNGVNVGFIGLMGEAAATDAAASAPVTFYKLSTHYADVQSLVDNLRSNGAQMVIALSHSGTDPSGTSGEDVELARHVRGIDVIASGHTHTPLLSVHAIPNGTWTTQIIDAGAYGTNVARLDLTFNRSTSTTTVNAYNNAPMTDATVAPDPVMTRIVQLTDAQLNAALAPFFKTAFPDYTASSVATGIYHPVATTAQDMVSNSSNNVAAPNGLGDLAADAQRNTANAILAKVPAGIPGFDYTPFQLGAVATGVLRTRLRAGVPLSFADIYDELPLGITPDPTQALPVGYPMLNVYLNVDDLKQVAALQLVAQSHLVDPDFYLNLSGIQYSLKPDEAKAYFKSATAASVLQITSAKAAAGSSAALQALGALQNAPTTLIALAASNPYAAALVNLNDPGNFAANLAEVGNVAIAAATGKISSYIVSKAVAAIDTVSGFAPTDPENTGATTPLPSGTRVRTIVDFYAALLLGAVNAQYGTTIALYPSATSASPLQSIVQLLGNRVDADPATPGVQELKEWMSLLSYVTAGLGGTIGSDYASTTNFAEFPTFGKAVRTRDANYPLAQIGQMMTTLGGLQSAP